jgi:hypothetical protein
VLATPVTNPGAVDALISSLTSLYPASLIALTTYVYRRPLSSDDIIATVEEPS